MSRIYIRDNFQGEDWHFYDFAGRGDSDVAFDLYGQLAAAPTLQSLANTSLDRSGRLRIFGNNFGEMQGSGQVLIDGVPAIAGTWSGPMVSAYIPETAGPGPVTVQVITSGGASNVLNVDVTLRQADGRLDWRFEAEGLYSSVRPAIGPDGTVYVVSIDDDLYALTPDGGLKWIVKDAGGSGVDVAPDGTIYAGNNYVITAINPDGSVKWVYGQEPSALYLLGPSVGPDGNIYAVATIGLGVFSLTPQGELRWSYPEEYRYPTSRNQELQFGYNGDTLQMYYHANQRTRFFSADGDLVFDSGLYMGDSSPDVGPDGTIYDGALANAQVLRRYSPDGDILDVFAPPVPNDGGAVARVAQSTGNVYHKQNLDILRSLTPDLDVRWERTTGLVLGIPHPDASDRLLAMSASEGYGVSGFVVGMSTTDGSELWRVNWQNAQGLIQLGGNPRFTDDGNTLYVNSLLAGQPADEVFYLNAIDSSPDGAPACSQDCLRSTAVQFGYRPHNGETAVVARVTVKDETGAPVVGATVEATLTLPDGSTKAGTWVSNSKGYAFFGDLGGPGTYSLTVDNITLAGMTFDPLNSVLTGSVIVPDAQ